MCNVYICRMYVLTCSGCSIRFAYLSVCVGDYGTAAARFDPPFPVFTAKEILCLSFHASQRWEAAFGALAG